MDVTRRDFLNGSALTIAAGLTPAAPWYIESGQGMGATLGTADDRKAYALTDRGTYLAFTHPNSAGMHHLRDLAKFLWGARQEQPTLLDGEIQPGDADLISDGKALIEQPEPATV